MNGYSFFYVLVFLLLVASCQEDNPESIVSSEQSKIRAYLDTIGLSDVEADTSGIYAWPMELNPTGKTQQEGNVLSFFYSLSVLEEDVIDVRDSLDEDTTVVKQGVRAIYPVGIDQALSYLKEGEKWAFIIPSESGYGTFSFSTLIPESATLYLEIELLTIRTEDDVLDEELEIIDQFVAEAELSDTVKVPLNKPEVLPNGMVYKRLKAGSGATPATDQLVALTYEGRFMDSTVFDRAPNADFFEFFYGDDGIIPGLEIGLGRMSSGERALLIMPSYLGYRESAKVIPDFLTDEMAGLNIIPTYATKVGPYKPLIFELEVIDIN